METVNGEYRRFKADEAYSDAQKKELRRIEIRRRAREWAKPRVCDRIDDYSQESLDRLIKGTPATLRVTLIPHLTL